MFSVSYAASCGTTKPNDPPPYRKTDDEVITCKPGSYASVTKFPADVNLDGAVVYLQEGPLHTASIKASVTEAGCAENACAENAYAENACVEFAGAENAGVENADAENARAEKTGAEYAAIHIAYMANSLTALVVGLPLPPLEMQMHLANIQTIATQALKNNGIPIGPVEELPYSIQEHEPSDVEPDKTECVDGAPADPLCGVIPVETGIETMRDPLESCPEAKEFYEVNLEKLCMYCRDYSNVVIVGGKVVEAFCPQCCMLAAKEEDTLCTTCGRERLFVNTLGGFPKMCKKCHNDKNTPRVSRRRGKRRSRRGAGGTK
jgi:hypothetical protein